MKETRISTPLDSGVGGDGQVVGLSKLQAAHQQATTGNRYINYSIYKHTCKEKVPVEDFFNYQLSPINLCSARSLPLTASVCQNSKTQSSNKCIHKAK